MGMTLKPSRKRLAKKVYDMFFSAPSGYLYLRFHKVSAAFPAYIYFDSVKMLQNLRQFREIFPASQKIPAEGKLLVFGPGA